jgi:hypothetical protein
MLFKPIDRRSRYPLVAAFKDGHSHRPRMTTQIDLPPKCIIDNLIARQRVF